MTSHKLESAFIEGYSTPETVSKANNFGNYEFDYYTHECEICENTGIVDCSYTNGTIEFCKSCQIGTKLSNAAAEQMFNEVCKIGQNTTLMNKAMELVDFDFQELEDNVTELSCDLLRRKEHYDKLCARFTNAVLADDYVMDNNPFIELRNLIREAKEVIAASEAQLLSAQNELAKFVDNVND